MIDLHQHIQSIVTLPSITVRDVAGALGVALRKERENPYWEFYEAGLGGPFERVLFNLSRNSPAWLLAWDYELAQAPHESKVNLAPYGPVIEISVNPRIPPEGTQTFKYKYSGLELFVEFTHASRLLRGAALHGN